MLVRDPDAGSASGLAVFLMRRHAAMDFAAGVMVFPGGESTTATATPTWAGWGHGPVRRRSGGRSGSASSLISPKPWSARRPARRSRSRGAIRRAGRSGPFGTEQHRLGCLGVRRRASRTGRPDAVLRGLPAAGKAGAAIRPATALGQLGHPEAELTRRYDTYFFVGALPEGQRADGENTESDRAGWVLPADAIADFAAGRNFLLPPTWTQLDSLAGHTVADVLAVERQIVPVQPQLARNGDNWEIEFFDSDRYNQARRSGGSTGWPL